MRDNEPEIFRKTWKWLDAKEYLSCRATGVMKASRDVAGATFPYDVKRGCWSEELCRMTERFFAESTAEDEKMMDAEGRRQGFFTWEREELYYVDSDSFEPEWMSLAP